MAVTSEHLRVLPDLRTPIRSFVEKILSGHEVSDSKRLEQTRGLNPVTASQVDSASAMFKELDEVLAGRIPNKRFIGV